MFWIPADYAQGINPSCGCPRPLGPKKIRGKGTSLPGAHRALHIHPSVSLDPSELESLGAAEPGRREENPARGPIEFRALISHAQSFAVGIGRGWGVPKPLSWSLVCPGPHTQQRRPATCLTPGRGPAVGTHADPGSWPVAAGSRLCAAPQVGAKQHPRSPAAPGFASPTPSLSSCSALEAALGGALATGLVD